MKPISVTNTLLAAIALLLALTMLAGPTKDASAARQLQYKVTDVLGNPALTPKQRLEEKIQREAANGWELIIAYHDGTGDYLIFKK